MKEYLKEIKINNFPERLIITLLIVCVILVIGKEIILSSLVEGKIDISYTTINQISNKPRKIGIQIINSIQSSTCDRFKEEQCSFLLSLLVGTSIIEKNTNNLNMINDFRKTGIAHLLSVSGFNVTIIIQIVTLLLILFPLRIRLVFIIIFVLFYITVLIGINNIPAVRAAIFGIIYIITKYLGYGVNIKRLLIYYIFISLILDLTIITNLSFLLTVGSILGIVIFQKRVSAHVSNILAFPFDEAFSTTISALLIVTPISAIFFDSISIIAPISNIIVTPFAPILTVMYMLFLITSSWLREVIAYLLQLILDSLFYIISFLSKSEISEIYLPKYLMVTILLVILLFYLIKRIPFKHLFRQKRKYL